MFNRKLKSDSFTDLISSSMSVKGDIIFADTLKIEGLVSGDYILSAAYTGTQDSHTKCNDRLIIAEKSIVDSSTVKASNMIIGGQCTSKILHAEDTMRILSSGVISNATIYYRNLEIEPGALLRNCQMKHLDHCSEGEEI
jgi:cytoskeletal protein CcmA (bactofilin family)